MVYELITEIERANQNTRNAISKTENSIIFNKIILQGRTRYKVIKLVI